MPSIFSSPIVAYTCSSPSLNSDLDFLRSWCDKIPIEIDIFTEEAHPSDPNRPVWSDLLTEIERGNITTLVVPSLFHISGDDYISLSKFLVFLKKHGGTLKSLTEVIDSRRESRNDIILRLIHDTKKVNDSRSAQ